METDNKRHPESMNPELNRCKGALIGLAIGDALGTTLEFSRPGTFMPLTDIVGGGPFSMRPGQWTDDTSMALCLAESLIEKHGFDAMDQLEKYVRWFREGYNSSTGSCFDIGNATRLALMVYENTGEVICGSSSPYTAGNGSIMRLSPVPVYYYNELENMMHYAMLSSKTTHAAPQCISACQYMSGLIAGAILGVDKETLLSASYTPIPGFWDDHPLDEPIAEVAEGSFKILQPPAIAGSGYVVKTLEAALWAFYHTDNFESGALKAVNLGDDADTVGAVYGQIAGAYYGMSGISEHWRAKLYDGERIESLAEKLYSKNKS